MRRDSDINAWDAVCELATNIKIIIMKDFSEITEQKISEKYNGLSQDLKDVLSSADTSAIIENIAVKYQLDEEKITMLIQLVGLVILGFATFEDIKIEMKEVIDINPSFIPLIADEIHQKIFLPITNSLQKTPAPPAAPVPAAAPVIPPVDEYRESPIGPEVIDLRKSPPVVPVPISPSIETKPPAPIAPKPIIPPPPPSPPVQQPPLIKAEPHKAPVPAPLSGMPQVILRSPGLPPTDLSRDILDLRKDKGEF